MWEDEKGRRQERQGRERQLAPPYETGSTDKVNTDLSSSELVLGGVGGREGKKAREMRKRKTAGTTISSLIPSLHDKVNTDLSSAELVLGGVGGREGKKARETRKRKTAGTAITYR